MKDVEKLEQTEVVEKTISLDQESRSDTSNVAEHTLAALICTLPIAVTLYLSWKDRKFMSTELSKQELVTRLSLYKSKPPTTIFINFLISLVGVENILGIRSSQFVTFASFYLVAIWSQASMVIVQVVGIVNEMHLEREYFWSMSLLIIVFISIALGSSIRLYRAQCTTTNDAQNGLTLLSSFQAWLTAFGCLFELCHYSTINFNNMVNYYSFLTNSAAEQRTLVLLVTTHVGAMVIVGAVLLTNFLCCLGFERETKPWIVDQQSTAIRMMICPLLSISILHCMQNEWADLFNS
ncbi:hypothetical protein KL946_003570 [Ogataea haglerorum]|uniref:Uncharacterized protein n=1 Tax=Ogataea haglerorum TaxID=1937702 RepID=A0ABQ7REJ0_9ASCO|nr:hypothetical protein KL946_003570 [Ogataea haglerorum]